MAAQFWRLQTRSTERIQGCLGRAACAFSCGLRRAGHGTSSRWRRPQRRLRLWARACCALGGAETGGTAGSRFAAANAVVVATQQPQMAAGVPHCLLPAASCAADTPARHRPRIARRTRTRRRGLCSAQPRDEARLWQAAVPAARRRRHRLGYCPRGAAHDALRQRLLDVLSCQRCHPQQTPLLRPRRQPAPANAPRRLQTPCRAWGCRWRRCGPSRRRTQARSLQRAVGLTAAKRRRRRVARRSASCRSRGSPRRKSCTPSWRPPRRRTAAPGPSCSRSRRASALRCSRAHPAAGSGQR